MAHDAHDSLTRHWQTLWRDAGATPAPDLLPRLFAAYSEPHRHYHTLQHLGECLAHLQTMAQVPDHPVDVGLALWFHDAILESGRQDNEARSADWARQAILDAGLPASMADRVADLIMATCHHATPTGIDAEVLVDIDLGILGAPSARFDEYERQVREEYAFLPDSVFRQGRLQVLQHFMERPRLFSTAAFFGRYEAQARENLIRSIGRLQGELSAPSSEKC